MSLSEVSIHAFIAENGIRTETGRLLTFQDHKFLFDIYSDRSDQICCAKAAQIGFTTMAIIKTLWTSKTEGVDAIYTLPTADDIRALVGSKVNRIIDLNPTLKKWVGNGDSVERKSVGRNVIHFRGTWTERAALMVTSGLNVHDEVDRSNLDVLEQYESRQQWSPVKRRWIFSNPSLPGIGVDAYWERSDKKVWKVTCGKCKAEQELRYPDNVDRIMGVYVCSSCGNDITEVRRNGKWVRTGSGKWSGYRISLLMCPWVKADEIIRLAEEKSPEYFHNFVLGEPYAPKEAKVTRKMLTNLLSQTDNSQVKTVIGSDSGNVKHYVMGNAEGIYFYGKTENWDDIAKLLEERKDAVLICDAMPDITGPRALRDRFPGRVFLNFYSRDRKSERIIRWGEGKESGTVLSDRNRLIQTVVDEMAANRMTLNGKESDWVDFFRHWENMYRTSVTNSLGVPEFKWEHDGPDHWAHATAYWRIGMDKFGFGGGHVWLSKEGGKLDENISSFGPGLRGRFIMPVIDDDNDDC